MPAATTKADLLAVTEKDHAKLIALIDKIPDAQAMLKREDDTSIKDVIVHRAHWIDLFLGWYADGKDGKEVAMPAPGFKWSDLKAYNADLRAKTQHLDWDDAKTRLSDAHDRLMRFITHRTDAQLYGGPMKGGNGKWTTGRFAEASGPSHYRSAAKWLRACLRADNAK